MAADELLILHDSVNRNVLDLSFPRQRCLILLIYLRLSLAAQHGSGLQILWSQLISWTLVLVADDFALDSFRLPEHSRPLLFSGLRSLQGLAVESEILALDIIVVSLVNLRKECCLLLIHQIIFILERCCQ